jgi:tetrapyrrole methylase family protein/MazG family protein
MKDTTTASFSRLVQIINQLRRECPWDRQQTPESLRSYLLEETYEALETIDRADWDKLKEELGDLLLQIILHSVIAAEQNRFTLQQVLDGITAKMIERHPHVFDRRSVNGIKDIVHNWEQIKVSKEQRPSLLTGIPIQLSALLRAQRLQEKAATVNFDWPEVNGVLQKVEEEIGELRQAVTAGKPEQMQEELGDLLFSLVNLCRFLGVAAEDALRLSNEKFTRRFHFIEQHYGHDYEKMKQARLEDLDKIWEKSKG